MRILLSCSLPADALYVQVLVAGFGRSGHAVGDIPGVRFKVRSLSLASLYEIIILNNLFVSVLLPRIISIVISHRHHAHRVHPVHSLTCAILQIVKVAGVALLSLFKQKKDKPRS